MQQFAKMEAHLRRVLVPSPAPLYLMRSYRRREPTEYDIFCCLGAALTWRKIPARVIAGHYLGWLFQFPRRSLHYLRKHGRAAKRGYGRSLAGQIADMAVLAARAGSSPREYYQYGLARFRGGAEMRRYVSTEQNAAIKRACVLRSLQRHRSEFDVDDKYAFEAHCRAHGWASTETVVLVGPNGLTDVFGGASGGELPEADIFVKPREGVKGAGAERFDHAGSSIFVAPDGERLTAAALRQRLVRSSRALGGVLLVQRRLVNDPTIAAMAGQAFATTRIVTLDNEAGEPEVVFSCLRTGGGAGSFLDNYHAGGVAFPVDIESGELSAGRRLESGGVLQFHTHHPVTGARMQGERLPGWPDACALALALHRSIPGILLAGWDIGFAPQGPTVVEVNAPPGLPIVQLVEGFLGTRYSELLAHHALRYLQETEPADSRWLIGADRPQRERNPAGARDHDRGVERPLGA